MTAPLLESFVAGRWYAAPDDGTPIADAVVRTAFDGLRSRNGRNRARDESLDHLSGSGTAQ